MKYKIVGFIVLLSVVIQFIPYGKNHIDPKVIAEPNWDSPKTKELFVRACGDCHSNNTKWPWYSSIAPISWSVYHHVKEGREHFNVSMWNIQKKNKGNEAVEELEEGEMPLQSYLLAHPEARLNDTEKKILIDGLRSTFGEKKED